MIRFGMRRRVRRYRQRSIRYSQGSVIRLAGNHSLARHCRAFADMSPQILVNTIRNEIAMCSEKAYPSIPILNGINLFFLSSEGEVVEFAREVSPSPAMIQEQAANSRIEGLAHSGRTDLLPTRR